LGDRSASVKIPQLEDPIFGSFHQLGQLLDQALLLEDQIMVKWKFGFSFELVRIVLPKQLPVDPLIEIQQLLPHLK